MLLVNFIFQLLNNFLYFCKKLIDKKVLMIDSCAIMQPTYLPWLGYFDLMDQVDFFVFLDSVQMTRRSWQVRNRILTHNGELFLTIPVKDGSRSETYLNNALIADDVKWRGKHLQTIEMSYKKRPYFHEVFEFIYPLINEGSTILGDLNIVIIESIAKRIGITTELKKSSDLNDLQGQKEERLIEICKQIGCRTYVSPQGSSAYIESEREGGLFLENGINLFYMNYEHPVYEQYSRKDFVPFMGIIDLLFNVGFDGSLEVIRSGHKSPLTYKEFREHYLNN